jgi:hypothetical protein
MQLLLRIVLRWFPDRPFVFAGDSGYGSHAMALFAHRQHGRLSLVSRFVADANLYDPPPVVVGKKPSGRPRQKGAKRPAPQTVVAEATRQSLTVSWYGGGRRRVQVVSAVGHWYKAGQGLVAVCWVYVHDQTGTHRDDYLYGSDTTLTSREILEEYTGRWNIEKAQADYPSSRSWVGTVRIGYHRRNGVARAGRVVPATPGRSYRRSRMSDATRRAASPRASSRSHPR